MEAEFNQPSSTAIPSEQLPSGMSSSLPTYPAGSRPCVVCKNVHLSCDRARPCSRCVRIGRETDCIDPPDIPRGRAKADGPAKRKPKRTSDHQSITPQLTFTNHPQLAGTFENPAMVGGEQPVAASGIDLQMAEGRVWYYYTRTVILGCTHELASYLGYQIHDLIGLPSNVLEPPEVIS
jgi:hypothetical protein